MKPPRADPFFLPGKSNTIIIFIHGFTASPSEVLPTALLLNQHGGLSVSGPLLPGHGTTPESLNQTTWEMWYEALKSEYLFRQQQYSSIFVAGLSMGALLAIYAGINLRGLKGVIAINAPIFIQYPVQTALAPLIEKYSPYIRKKKGLPIIEQERIGRWAYDVLPVKAFRSLRKLRNLVIKDIEQLRIPFLVLQALKDESVKAKSAGFLIRRAKNALVCYKELPESYHVATMGQEKELIAGTIIKFVRRYEKQEE
ncbi:MAG: hypothetical protein GX550_06375 [Syntrophomonadaceae bacterium]|nr:hypothetical protein [Syntrophomonadaceae bacterium]